MSMRPFASYWSFSMCSPWFALTLSLFSFFACDRPAATKPPAATEPASAPAPTVAPGSAAEPASAPAPTVAPGSAAGSNVSADRSKDPAFALKEVNGKYIGHVADQCPWGPTTQNSTQVLPPIDSKDYKLVGDKLEIQLPYGGCPQWTGYTVVTGNSSPLPFYVCHEIQHDTCEMAGFKTWVFDISKQLKANKATAVAFGVPTGVH